MVPLGVLINIRLIRRKLNIRKWLFVNLKLQCMPAIHIVDRYFEAVRDLEVVNDGKGLDYFLQEADFVDCETLPAGFQSGYVACVVGSKHATKQMPTDLMADLCRKIQKPTSNGLTRFSMYSYTVSYTITSS